MINLALNGRDNNELDRLLAQREETTQAILELVRHENPDLVEYVAREGGEQDGLCDEGVADFMASAADSIPWLLEPFVPKQSFVVVQGGPKSGKTWFGAWLAASCAELGFKVAVVEEEGAKEVLRDRLKPFVLDPARVNGTLRVLYKKRVRLDDERTLAALCRLYKGFDLIVLDPFVRLHRRKEKDSDEMMIPLSAIATLIAETGAAVILIHHTKKGESWNRSSNSEAQLDDGRGSGAIAGEADNVISIRGVPRKERQQGFVRFFVENPGSRVGPEFDKRTAVVDLAEGTASPLSWVTPKEVNGDDADSIQEAVDSIIECSKLPKTEGRAVSATAIRKILKLNKAAVLEAVARCVRHGILEAVEGKWGPVYFKPERPDAA